MLRFRRFYITLNIPETDNVKLDVYVTTKNSLDSKKKAIQAPMSIHWKLAAI